MYCRHSAGHLRLALLYALSFSLRTLFPGVYFYQLFFLTVFRSLFTRTFYPSLALLLVMTHHSSRLNAGKKLPQVLAAEESASSPDVTLDLFTLPLIPEIVSCKCRAKVDDSSHMVCCKYCFSWSHSACYGLTPGEAAAMKSFICEACSLQVPCTSEGQTTTVEPRPPVYPRVTM